jgi:hypothetical protein
MPYGELRTSGCWPDGDAPSPDVAGRSVAIPAHLAPGHAARAFHRRPDLHDDIPIPRGDAQGAFVNRSRTNDRGYRIG